MTVSWYRPVSSRVAPDGSMTALIPVTAAWTMVRPVSTARSCPAALGGEQQALGGQVGRVELGGGAEQDGGAGGAGRPGDRGQPVGVGQGVGVGRPLAPDDQVGRPAGG